MLMSLMSATSSGSAIATDRGCLLLGKPGEFQAATGLVRFSSATLCARLCVLRGKKANVQHRGRGVFRRGSQRWVSEDYLLVECARPRAQQRWEGGWPSNIPPSWAMRNMLWLRTATLRHTPTRSIRALGTLANHLRTRGFRKLRAKSP